MSVNMIKKGLVVAISIISLSGCASQPSSAFRLVPDTGEQPETPYERYAMLNKRYEMLQHELNRIAQDKQELEELLIHARNELQPARRQTEDQVEVYQAGVLAAQAEVARRQAVTQLSIAELENDFDRQISDLDTALELEIAKLKQSYAKQRTKLAIEHRTTVAQLSTSNMMGVATVTPPVMVDGRTYDTTQPKVVQVQPEATPSDEGSYQKVSLIKPKPATQEKQPPRRVKYDAVLVFEDSETRDLWFNFLTAHKINEKFKSQNREKGEFYIYVGTYNNPRQAQTRLNYVTSKIGTGSNAKLVTRTL